MNDMTAPSPPSPPVDPTAELERMTREATAALAQAMEHPAMKREPYRMILGAQQATLAAMLQTVKAFQAAGAPVPEEVLKQLTEAAHQGGAATMKRETARLVRSADGLRIGLLGAIAGGFFVAGFAAGVIMLLRLQGG